MSCHRIIRLRLSPEEQAKHEARVESATQEVWDLARVLQTAGGLAPGKVDVAPLYLRQAEHLVARGMRLTTAPREDRPVA